MNLSRTALAITILGTMLLPGTADASMFNVTNLGSNYTLQQDSAGTVHSVTSGDGSRTYAFEKSPVTQIYEFGPGYNYSYHNTYLLQNGTHKVGYMSYMLRGEGAVEAPIGFAPVWDWITTGSLHPVLDVNSHGEIVGLRAFPEGNIPDNDPFFWHSGAMFSNPDGTTHTDATGMHLASNSLNDYIASDLGIHLTSAVKVDDSGRIIAWGTLNGAPQDFLLTPDGVSSAAIPTPEPSTLAMTTIALVGFAFRRLIKRRRRKSEAIVG